MAKMITLFNKIRNLDDAKNLQEPMPGHKWVYQVSMGDEENTFTLRMFEDPQEALALEKIVETILKKIERLDDEAIKDRGRTFETLQQQQEGEEGENDDDRSTHDGWSWYYDKDDHNEKFERLVSQIITFARLEKDEDIQRANWIGVYAVQLKEKEENNRS